MLFPCLALVAGLILLVWSADWFVQGAASISRHLNVPPLLIGMVIVGFGTSLPEMTVSALAASQGNPGLALGNAFGSNITNIALILGLASVISPIAVSSRVLRKELPLLTLVTAFAIWQLIDGELSRFDAFELLALFVALMGWATWHGLRNGDDSLGREVEKELQSRTQPLHRAIPWLIISLLLLLASSRLLVWGAVEIARDLGVSDLLIGLTVVAIGTSLPELASSLVAARRGEHDLALGNVLGSNLFNTLAVVGIAGAIHPLSISPVLLHRDLPVMALLTLSLFLIGYGFRGPGLINRVEGAALLVIYLSYTLFLVFSAANAGT